MGMNVNGRKSDMAAQNLQNLRNLQNTQKTDKSDVIGGAQEVSINPNRPEGETESKTITIIHHSDGSVTGVYNGLDDGIVYEQMLDGTIVKDDNPARHADWRGFIQSDGDGHSVTCGPDWPVAGE